MEKTLLSASLIEEELAHLREASLYRQMKSLKPLSETRALFENQELILFCGNDYFGLSKHPQVIEAVQKAAQTYGVGSGAARLISGTTPAHLQLEEKIAQLKGKEKALVFSSGYMTNVGILTAFAGKEDLIVMDKLCHASIIDGARLSGATLRVFPHRNYERCEELLKKSQNYRRKILVSESVFSMDGDLADLSALARLKQEYQCLLMVDDAHATGVLNSGSRSDGTLETIRDQIDLCMGTLSKSLGCLGGFVAASSTLIDYLVNYARPFIFATSLPPLLCAGALKALEILAEDDSLKRRLWANIRAMEKGLRKAGLLSTPAQSSILPAVIGNEGKALSLSQRLLEKGFFVPAIRTPTVPKGQARLRITLSALHKRGQIEDFLRSLEAIL